MDSMQFQKRLTGRLKEMRSHDLFRNRLRSELIQLSLSVDAVDQSVDNIHQTILQEVVDDLQMKERSEPLVYTRIHWREDEEREPEQVIPVRRATSSSPIAEVKPLERIRPRTSERRGSLGRPRTTPADLHEAHQRPPDWQDTI
jgi:hypothetical protein